MIPRILVCGGRHYRDRFNLYKQLNEISAERGWSKVTVITGMATGADSLAWDWAFLNFHYIMEFPANWAKYGNSAGYKRNVQMLKEGKPDLVVAFEGGKGTQNMIDIAKNAGVDIIQVFSTVY